LYMFTALNDRKTQRYVYDLKRHGRRPVWGTILVFALWGSRKP